MDGKAGISIASLGEGVRGFGWDDEVLAGLERILMGPAINADSLWE